MRWDKRSIFETECYSVFASSYAPPPGLRKRRMSSLAKTLENVRKPLSHAQREAIIKCVEDNFDDPYGDGDQSQIPEASHPAAVALRAGKKGKWPRMNMEMTIPLRTARGTALDVPECILSGRPESIFHFKCFLGYLEAVHDAIALAKEEVRAGKPNALTDLLESRLSLLRFTPLHYCCFGARMRVASIVDVERSKMMHFEEVARELIGAGARVDSRDLVGYTPLGLVADDKATKDSIVMVPLLVSLGADVDAKNRFGEPIITDAIAGGNLLAYKAMMDAGADLEAQDRAGVTVLIKTKMSPAFNKASIGERREKMLSEEACATCGKKGVSKYCASCRKLYYCSRSCQVKDWKQGHKAKCGKEEPDTEYLDLVVGVMTVSPSIAIHHISVAATGDPRIDSMLEMKPRNFGQAFTVGVFLLVGREVGREGDDAVVAIVRKDGSFLRLRSGGRGFVAYDTLRNLTMASGDDSREIYLLAKWIEPAKISGSNRKENAVLRLDLSKVLPPPKTPW